MQQRKVHALQRQIAPLARHCLRLETTSRLYAKSRAGLVLLGLGTVLVVERLCGTAFGLLTAGVFLAAFLTVVAFHNRIKAGIVRHTIWRRLKATHLARVLRDWHHIPHASQAREEPEHVFAADLNLTGDRSLLHLLDTTTSHGGSARLRTWFLQPVLDAGEIRTRQEQVRELVPLAAFRDHLALCGALVASDPDARWEEESVLAWLHQQPPSFPLARWVGILGLLAATNIVLMSLYALSLVPAWWPLSLALYLFCTYLQRRGTPALCRGVSSGTRPRALACRLALPGDLTGTVGHPASPSSGSILARGAGALGGAQTDHPHCWGGRSTSRAICSLPDQRTGALGSVLRPSASPV